MIQTIHKMYPAHQHATAVRSTAFILIVFFFSACSQFFGGDSDHEQTGIQINGTHLNLLNAISTKFSKAVYCGS
jgi:hypothetical protein